MEIILENTGRRYNNEWIYRKINYSFIAGFTYVITGSNGSGKSTLMQTLLGFILPSEGKITYKLKQNTIKNEDFFNHVSVAAPYIDVYDDYNLLELLDFHQALKPLVVNKQEFIDLSGLQASATKPIKNYSSGMKQRVKLSLAILSDVPVLLLDEPCSNLDSDARKWYADTLLKYKQNRLVIIASNNFTEEYPGAQHFINVGDYKNDLIL